ncbi:LOW QUALITY PROTEIN: IQ domain-containing protein C-like [Lacerta agilis]|uniref:LOW QUALITY PROTEIN: IQ domain-containing protein C-like n=1 Tax=Lacerta agilis TaxID=80427 RepID=UPI0014193781|nr:LOW QUALITY PROTEIN: IQ domain-containing protein C-like [Lacerta agilis]
MMEESEEEQQQLVLRRVVTLQAHVRGYLVRKKFQSLKGEYESIIKEIEGDLDWLKWNRHSMPVPVLLPKVCYRIFITLRSEKDLDCKMQSPAEMVAKTEAEDHLVGRPPRNVCSLPGESEEGKQAPQSMSSKWSSMILNKESPKLSQELHFQRVPEMLQAVPDLQRYQKHLAMELLWLQQAIASHKNARAGPQGAMGCLLCMGRRC